MCVCVCERERERETERERESQTIKQSLKGMESDRYDTVYRTRHVKQVHIFYYLFIYARMCGSRDSLLEESWTRDRKVASSYPGSSGWRIFFFIVNVLTLIRCAFYPRVTAVARKRP